jgi:hypothetical protein
MVSRSKNIKTKGARFQGKFKAHGIQNMNSKQRRAEKRKYPLEKDIAMKNEHHEDCNIAGKYTKRNQQSYSVSKVVRYIWTVICISVTLLGLFEIWPKVSIEPYASTNYHEPFAQLLYIKNENLYPIYNVDPGCELHKVTSSYGVGISGISLYSRKDVIERLGRNEKTTFNCNIGTPSDPIVTTMEINPVVQYVLPFGIHWCQTERFIGKKSDDGTYIWTYHGGERCKASLINY